MPKTFGGPAQGPLTPPVTSGMSLAGPSQPVKPPVAPQAPTPKPVVWNKADPNATAIGPNGEKSDWAVARENRISGKSLPPGTGVLPASHGMPERNVLDGQTHFGSDWTQGMGEAVQHPVTAVKDAVSDLGNGVKDIVGRGVTWTGEKFREGMTNDPKVQKGMEDMGALREGIDWLKKNKGMAMGIGGMGLLLPLLMMLMNRGGGGGEGTTVNNNFGGGAGPKETTSWLS